MRCKILEKPTQIRSLIFSSLITLTLIFIAIIYVDESQLVSAADFDLASPAPPKIWFSPDIGATDTINLFTEPEKWPFARRKTRVFKWYQGNIQNSCSICGQNTLDNLNAAGAFFKLNNWGIEQAIEVGAVKPHVCTADKTARSSINAIKAILDRGGTLRYLAMDEPYIGGQMTVNGRTCKYTMEQSAVQTADFVARVHAVYPNVMIGDIEPYPHFSLDQIKQWIMKLEELGAKPAFFQIDPNHDHPKYNIGDMRNLYEFLKQRGIPFGYIFASDRKSSDQMYFNDVMKRVNAVKSSIGLPDQIIFQSWATGPSGKRDMPVNLPENNSSIYSHTRLINNGWRVLADNNAQFSQNVPSLMEAGEAYSVSLTFRNTSNLLWTKRDAYRLGSQTPQDNTRWGLGRVDLAEGEIVLPGQNKTFTFIVRAPVIPGIYNFQWQMVQEAVEWFGDLSPNVIVKVIPR